MKTFIQTLSLVLGTAAAGTTLFVLASASFTAAWRTEIVIALPASLALIAVGFWDYSRRAESIVLRNNVVRPPLPSKGEPSRSARDAHTSHRKNLAA